METNDLVVNADQHKFEMHIGNQVVFIDYKLKDNVMALLHTQVPSDLEGKGYGKAIVEKTLDYIKSNNYAIAPLCSFVAAYINRHPQWKDNISGSYK